MVHQMFDELTASGSPEFWFYTINAHYFQAINLWCMVFGTNKNETHWRNLGIQENLGHRIISSLGITESIYRAYWESVVEWRNKYSAHRVPGFLEATPDLKIARSVALLFPDWVETNTSIVFGFTLESCEEEFIEQLQASLRTMLEHKK
ncbi:hypothetical protein [Paenibacillus gansuensis]|uniref:Uncharacterized protein n=1 Tax=Paenibacillus gansuensis TaxID=306542 RepID=A0ABW5PIN7_9BACL